MVRILYWFFCAGKENDNRFRVVSYIYAYIYNYYIEQSLPIIGPLQLAITWLDSAMLESKLRWKLFCSRTAPRTCVRCVVWRRNSEVQCSSPRPHYVNSQQISLLLLGIGFSRIPTKKMARGVQFRVDQNITNL